MHCTLALTLTKQNQNPSWSQLTCQQLCRRLHATFPLTPQSEGCVELQAAAEQGSSARGPTELATFLSQMLRPTGLLPKQALHDLEDGSPKIHSMQGFYVQVTLSPAQPGTGKTLVPSQVAS